MDKHEKFWTTVLVGVAAVGMALVLVTDADLRRVANALSVAVFGLLWWRLISTWDVLTRLEKVTIGLFAFGPLTSSLASLTLMARMDLPYNPWVWLVVVHRVAVVVVILAWPWLLRCRHRASDLPPIRLSQG